ncbi:class I SAM-dependent methyltransferase [Nocardia sp. CDC159]|uniref:Class I SAM-dependent methyltransferase n=1 Tax=Nocardia pulmonis TaxID=2951408 RepID=A0A9X2E785_9NOCA|nr:MULTISPECIES: class I SAM-dependent methyltransferase [Nocardia]MCM6775529.1 class I SAM-dependent methyltransferase [Nocardia pulmonis]MCM6787737.1 class I SAM-dependent methyltransferase [Nocardia sp. CDC159]
MPVSLHSTGKASFDDIYDRPDPSAYYGRLAELDYCIPELAKPHFHGLFAECAATLGHPPTVLDLGCSYGVNAALLRFDATIAELAEHYRSGDTAARIARDRDRLAGVDHQPGVRFIGMDASAPALRYAAAAGLLHEVVHADLEVADPTEPQRQLLASADVVISTGCIGYISERTLLRVARAHGHRLPWMMHFVMRMFDFEPIGRELARIGYRVERRPGTFRQRRFASADEQKQVLKALSDRGIDPTGLEADGWLHAELHICLPDDRPTPHHREDRP